MNKALVWGAAATLAGAAIVGATVHVGNRATAQVEQTLRESLQAVPGAKLVAEHKQRGVFSSAYNLTVQLGCYPSPEGQGSIRLRPLKVTLENEIQHGPFPGGARVGAAVVRSQLRLPDEWRGKLSELIGDQHPLEVETKVGFSGDFVASARLPSVRARQDGQTFSLLPVKIEASASSEVQGQQLPYRLKVSPVQASFESRSVQGKLAIGAIQTRGSLGRDAKGWSLFAPANSDTSIESLRFDGSVLLESGELRGGALEATDIQLHGRNEVDAEGLWSTRSSAAFRGRINDFEIDKVDVQTMLKRVSVESYSNLLKDLSSVLLTCDASQPATSPEMLAKIRTRVLDMFKHDPEYSLEKLRVQVDGKSAELSYRVAMQGVTADDLLSLSPHALAKRTHKQGNLRIHRGLIELALDRFKEADGPEPKEQVSADQVVRALVAHYEELGHVRRDGEYLVTDATWQNDQLLLNGKPIQDVRLSVASAP